LRRDEIGDKAMAGRGILIPIRTLLRDVRGVSAIEFALIAPLLILIYCGMAALTSALMAARKSSHAVSTVGDLIAQVQSVSTSNTGTVANDVPNLFQAALDVMAPYPTANNTTPLLELRATSIVKQSNGSIQVAWSCTPTNQSVLLPMAVNTTLVSAPGAATPIVNTTLSSLLVNTGDTVIMSEGRYTFTSIVSAFLPNNMVFTNTYYFKPRQTTAVTTPGTSTANGVACNG
jgi:Flp pilus assembly protein TadG